MPIRKYIFLSIVIMSLTGCVATKIPSKSEYRINTNLLVTKSNNLACKDKSLKVAQAFSVGSLMTNRMTYALGDSKQYVYSQSLWAQTPNTALTAKFLKLIRDSELFKSVQASKSRSKNDFILEINIEDFMQYFDKDSKNSYANISINLTLIDVKSNQVFASKTFDSQVDVVTLNAEGGVEGLNKALNNVLKNTNTWISGVCK